MDLRAGDIAEILVENPRGSTLKKGDIVLVTYLSSPYYYVARPGSSGMPYVDAQHIKKVGEFKREGGNDMKKVIWEVIIVDKTEDKIILREMVIDGDEKSACSKVSISAADKLKTLSFDDLAYITKELGSYEKKDKGKKVK